MEETLRFTEIQQGAVALPVAASPPWPHAAELQMARRFFGAEV